MDDFVEGAGEEQHFIWTHADPLVGLFVVQQSDLIAEALLEKFVLTYCLGYGGCVGEGIGVEWFYAVGQCEPPVGC